MSLQHSCTRLSVRVLISVMFALGPALARTPATPTRLNDADPTAARSPAAAAKRAVTQSTELPRTYFFGTWRYVGVENGDAIEIEWTLFPSGRLSYHFRVNGIPSRGSDGIWAWQGGIMEETWHRLDGSTGHGRGSVEQIDANTIRLTIQDNGDDAYRGLVRVYRRVGPPPLSQRQPPLRP